MMRAMMRHCWWWSISINSTGANTCLRFVDCWCSIRHCRLAVVGISRWRHLTQHHGVLAPAWPRPLGCSIRPITVPPQCCPACTPRCTTCVWHAHGDIPARNQGPSCGVAGPIPRLYGSARYSIGCGGSLCFGRVFWGSFDGMSNVINTGLGWQGSSRPVSRVCTAATAYCAARQRLAEWGGTTMYLNAISSKFIVSVCQRDSWHSCNIGNKCAQTAATLPSRYCGSCNQGFWYDRSSCRF
jgi:hypothetical protein